MERDEVREHLIAQHAMDVPAMEDVAERLAAAAGTDVPYETWHDFDHQRRYRNRPEPDHSHSDDDVAVW